MASIELYNISIVFILAYFVPTKYTSFWVRLLCLNCDVVNTFFNIFMEILDGADGATLLNVQLFVVWNNVIVIDSKTIEINNFFIVWFSVF